jgi:hypothetical protein
VLFVEFAKAADDWLRCSDTVEIGCGFLSGFVREMRDKDIAGGGIDIIAFLGSEGS